MTPSEALELLANVTGGVNLTRAQHEKIVAALNVLGDLVRSQQEVKPA